MAGQEYESTCALLDMRREKQEEEKEKSKAFNAETQRKDEESGAEELFVAWNLALV